MVVVTELVSHAACHASFTEKLRKLVLLATLRLPTHFFLASLPGVSTSVYNLTCAHVSPPMRIAHTHFTLPCDDETHIFQ